MMYWTPSSCSADDTECIKCALCFNFVLLPKVCDKLENLPMNTTVSRVDASSAVRTRRQRKANKSQTLSIRLTDSDERLLDLCAERLDMKRSDLSVTCYMPVRQP